MFAAVLQVRNQRGGGEGGGLPCPSSKFKEKCPDFGQKMPSLDLSMGLISHLKCCFKHI